MTGTPVPVHTDPQAIAAEDALLTDGSTVHIRRIGPRDRAAVLDLHARMSVENLRLRFFAAGRHAAEETADRLCRPPSAGLLALGAFHGDDLVGVAEYHVDAEQPNRADLGLAVAEGWHGRGVGTLLVEYLAHAAHARGVGRLTADTLADNHAVQEVFSNLGLPVRRRTGGGGEVRVVIDLTEEDERYRTAVDTRAGVADIASLVPLFLPASVVVVGAGRRPGSVGRTVLAKIRDGDFTGALYAVNPHAREICGIPASPAVAALPVVPDLAVLAVPAAAVPQVARECGLAGVRALVALTTGLDREQANGLLDACRRHSMRLLGPNCLGMAQTDPGVRLDATFAAGRPLAGTAGVAVQSGGVGIALLAQLSAAGIGVSTFASLGDKYDVSGNDLLCWWEADGRTDLALLHLESFGNPRAFARTARRVTRRMPVLTVDAGRSEAGRRAAASHTAAAATPTVTRQALFTQAGITATRSIGELAEAAALLHTQPLPGSGGRIAVVANAGGVGVLAADACVEAGLRVPRLPAGLAEHLRALLPPGAATGNPVDVTAAAGADDLRACLDLLTTGGVADAVLLALVATALAAAPGRDPVHALFEGPARRAVPLAAVLPDQRLPVRCPEAAGGRIPAYADAQTAARALAHAVGRARWLARPRGTERVPTGTDPARARAVVARFLAGHPADAWADPATCAAVLDAYGVRQSPWAWAEDETEVARAAARMAAHGLEGRVVLKAYWPGQVHKSEAGAVRTGLTADGRVRGAYREFVARFGGRLAGVVVQPHAEPGLELLAGVVQDAVFGPLVVAGLGGTATDVLDDRTARLAPLTDLDAREMLTSLRCAPLLLDRRGGGPVDLAALEDLLLRLSRMAVDLPELAEADINPVIARPGGITPVDVRMRLVPQHPHDPYLRRLRVLPERAPARTEEA